MAAAKMKANEDATVKGEIDLTLYDATPEPERRPNVAPPSFEGRLNLKEYAFQQPTKPFRRNRPAPKVEESNSDIVKKEQNTPNKGSKGSRSRPLVLTPTPGPDETRVTVKKEVKVEREVEVVTAPASESDQVATPTKVGEVEPSSPLIVPIQSTEWDLPIIKVPKLEPGQEKPVVEQVTKKKVRYREHVVIELDDSSPELESNVRSAAPTPSANAPSQAATAASQAKPALIAAISPSKPPTMQEFMDDSVAAAAAEYSPDQSSRESSSSDVARQRRRQRLVSGRRELSDLFKDDDEDDFRDENALLPPAQPAQPAPRPPSPFMRPPAPAPAPARPGPSIVPAARSPFFATSKSSIALASPSKRPSDSSGSGSPAKKARAPSSYKPPETYAHLQELTDLMAPNLLGIFVGVNPGLKSAAVGHSYAGPSNRFWKLLHTSGITERRVSPQEDTTLPEKYQFGNTNIVGRPTRNQMELSKHEMVDSVQALIAKVRKWKPESVVIVGKKIWEIIFSVRHGRGIQKDEFNYGWQADSERMGTPKSWEKEETTVDGKPWKGARVFVAASTSGAAAIPPGPEKERIWRELGEWVNKRREERGLTHYPPGPTYQKNL